MHIDTFTEHFKAIEDSRQSAKVTYPLFEVLFGTLCSVIAGARGWFDIREYILGQHDGFLSHSLLDAFSEVRSALWKAKHFRLKSTTGALKHVTAICSARISLTAMVHAWQGLKTIAMVEHFRVEKGKPLHQKKPDVEARVLTFIPYFTWAHRGEGEMRVWVDEAGR